MSRSNILKACISITALSTFAACATSAPANDSSQSIADLAAKPSAEEIAALKGRSALEQANFWNTQYNLHPTDLEVATSYINALMALKSYERAGEVAKFSSVSFPENPEVFMLLGKAMKKNNNPYEAARAFGQAADLSPYDAAPFAALAGVFDSEGDHESAQVAYQRALKIDPNRPVTLSNYGISLTLVGKLEQAEEALASAINLPDVSPAIRQNYALVLGLRGKFDEARKIAEIDAPNGVASRNADFLKAMIGDNAQLQSIAQQAAQTPARTAPAPIAQVETPKPAPTNPITTAALSDVTEPAAPAKPRVTNQGSSQVASATSTTGSPLRLRTRKRNRSSGGE